MSRHVARRLADDLANRFGADKLFRDVEQIEPSGNFTAALNAALGGCQGMPVLIGERWLVADTGEQRFHDPRDWVRLEVVTALQRDIRVIPVLIEDAALPAEDQLPADLKPLVLRQSCPAAPIPTSALRPAPSTLRARVRCWRESQSAPSGC